MKTIKTISLLSLITALAVIGLILGLNTDIKPDNNTAQKQILTSPTINDNRCIVTINNQKYDVTALRKTHSGGDIFVCNSDMTTTFFTQHNQNFLNTRMPKYKI
jgi:cytochrome b involved in lipid metabolism